MTGFSFVASQTCERRECPAVTLGFHRSCSRWVSFLERFGFREVTPPAHRAHVPFQPWFGAGDRFVIVAGEGYGTMANITLEHDGRELSSIHLVPPGERPRAGGQRDQLAIQATSGAGEQPGTSFTRVLRYRY